MSFYDLHRISLLQQRVMAHRPSHKRDSQLARIAVLRKEYILLEEESRKLNLRSQANAVATVKQLDTCANYNESKLDFVESGTTLYRHEPKLILLNFALEETISDHVAESCFEFCAPTSETLEAIDHHVFLEEPLQSLVFSLEHREFSEPLGHSISYQASRWCSMNQESMSYDTAVPVETVPEYHTRILHGLDVFWTKQTSHIRLFDRLHLTSTINLSRIRKGFAWQLRYLSWTTNRNPCECVQCYCVVDFGLFVCLRRSTIRCIYSGIVSTNNEIIVYKISSSYAIIHSGSASMNRLKHSHIHVSVTEVCSEILKLTHYERFVLMIMSLPAQPIHCRQILAGSVDFVCL